MKLYGKNPVLERLKSNPRSIRKIYIQQGHSDSGYIQRKARQWGIPVYQTAASKIQKLARSINAQGVFADIDDFVYLPYDELLQTAGKKKETILMLDNVTDPQNFGAIIRSCACLGRFALVIPTHKSVSVTESVLRVACGGENSVRISKVASLGKALRSARQAGYQIAGTVITSGEPLDQVRLSFPLALVIGSEEKGVRQVLKNEIDLAITVPMAQPRLSLNVAQAATLFCYEINRQRKLT